MNAVAFSPNGRQVLTVSSDSTIRLWDPVTGKELRRIESYEASLNAVVFTPDGKAVLTGGLGATPRLWDAASGKELLRYVGHRAKVNSVAYSPDGSLIISGYDDETASLWDAKTGDEIRKFVAHPDDDREIPYQVRCVAFSPDGSQVAVVNNLETQLWDAASDKELWVIKGHYQTAVFSPDGRYLLAGGHDPGVAYLLDAATGKEVRQFVGHTGNIESVAFSPDGRTVLTGGEDGTARLWNAGSGKNLLTLKPGSR